MHKSQVESWQFSVPTYLLWVSLGIRTESNLFWTGHIDTHTHKAVGASDRYYPVSLKLLVILTSLNT